MTTFTHAGLTCQLYGPKDGEPVVFLQGATGIAEMWLPVSRLMPEHRVIAVDLPGHGASWHTRWSSVFDSAVRVDSLLAALLEPGQKAHLVGFSLGGHVALEMTRRSSNLSSVLMTGVTLVPWPLRLRAFDTFITLLGPPWLMNLLLPVTSFFFWEGKNRKIVIGKLSERKSLRFWDYWRLTKELWHEGEGLEEFSTCDVPILVVAGEKEFPVVHDSLPLLPAVTGRAVAGVRSAALHEWPLIEAEPFATTVLEWLARPGELPSTLVPA